jgi:hypothetical protein
MTPHEVLTLQALKLKSENDAYNPNFTDALLNVDSEDTKKHYRNLCALIPADLFDDFEKYSHVLDLSKREFLTLAVREIISKTKAVLVEVKPFENIEEEN